MSKFKVGDKVVIADDSPSFYGLKGVVMKASRLYYSDCAYHVHLTGDPDCVWFPFSEDELEHE